MPVLWLARFRRQLKRRKLLRVDYFTFECKSPKRLLFLLFLQSLQEIPISGLSSCITTTLRAVRSELDILHQTASWKHRKEEGTVGKQLSADPCTLHRAKKIVDFLIDRVQFDTGNAKVGHVVWWVGCWAGSPWVDPRSKTPMPLSEPGRQWTSTSTAVSSSTLALQVWVTLFGELVGWLLRQGQTRVRRPLHPEENQASDDFFIYRVCFLHGQ